MRALLIGQFQPCHKGHCSLVNHLATAVDEVIVGIGSADKSHTVRNPFTSGERIRMVSNVASSIDARVSPVPVWDIDCNQRWVRYIINVCPHFDVVYSNNPLVKRFFEEQGVSVRGMQFYEREQ